MKVSIVDNQVIIEDQGGKKFLAEDVPKLAAKVAELQKENYAIKSQLAMVSSALMQTKNSIETAIRILGEVKT